jgi:hypothetical protein
MIPKTKEALDMINKLSKSLHVGNFYVIDLRDDGTVHLQGRRKGELVDKLTELRFKITEDNDGWLKLKPKNLAMVVEKKIAIGVSLQKTITRVLILK